MAFNSVLNYIKNTLLEKTQKEQEGMQMAELLKKCESASEELVPKILVRLEGVKSINEQNRLSVEAGIDRILDARDKAESLGDMQKDSITMTEQIVDDANNEGEITGLTEESFARVKSIAEMRFSM